MGQQEEKLKKEWLRFVKGLEEAKRAWENIRELRASMPSLEGLPVAWQEVMAKVSWQSRFEIALDSLMGYWQVYGGMEILIPLEEPKPKKEEKEKS